MKRHAIIEVSKEEVFDLIKAGIDPVDFGHYDKYIRIATKLWAGYINEQLVCAWGLIPISLISNNGYLWLHATEAIKGNEFLFIRQSKIVVEDLLKQWPALCGHTLIGQDRSIKWLRMLGAEFDNPVGKLLPFVIRGHYG